MYNTMPTELITLMYQTSKLFPFFFGTAMHLQLQF